VPTADAIVQPLTEREQDVLTYLAALLPTEEIAGRMFVSVNTVKPMCGPFSGSFSWLQAGDVRSV
jgi:FixJ family two-component response regulator